MQSTASVLYGHNSVRLRGAAASDGTAHRVRTSHAAAPRLVSRESVPREEFPSAFPTVLVAAKSEELGRRLAEGIDERNVLVLKAQNQEELLGVVQRHSRPIHVLLLDVEIGREQMAAHLKRYRAKMHVVLVSREFPAHTDRIMGPEAVLPHLRHLLQDLR